MSSLAAVLVQPWLQPLLRQDQALMSRVAGWRAPRWIRLWMVLSSRGGDGGLWWGAGVAILCFGGAGRWQSLGEGAVAAAAAVGCFTLLKRIARRARPCAAHSWSKLTAPDEFSFPSGHALTGFAVATSLYCAYPEFGVCLLACALSVALSRVVLGLHYLTDVLCGGALGTLIGGACAHWLLR